ncbi:hypothetical protein C2G38_2165127 [Gigaspora rosea]|uniref:Uncharacterized protein n=1 Tax=Gigaspora rosea TaxID=44941 RepID=A0A397VVL1_9GLOM|nr:hypothetical protein C2G38_2165127 [Gigaspora rosea]
MALSNYDPFNDTIDTIATIFVAIIVVGLFKCFEKDKLKDFSFINVFDDCIIFSSVIIYPFINGFQWYSYYTEDNKRFLVYALKIFGYGIIIVMCYFNMFLYGVVITGDVNINIMDNRDHISGYCIENFGTSRCKGISKALNVLAVISGYFLSTNSSTTKLAFTIYSISLSRLIDHFGDNEPKKIKTMISVYLNWHARMIKNDAIENFKEKLEDQIKKLKEITNLYDKTFEKKIGKIIKALENQKEELVNTILTCERAEINHKIIRINVSLLYLIKHITNLVNEEKKTPDDNIEMSSSGEENIDLNSKENIDSDNFYEKINKSADKTENKFELTIKLLLKRIELTIKLLLKRIGIEIGYEESNVELEIFLIKKIDIEYKKYEEINVDTENIMKEKKNLLAELIELIEDSRKKQNEMSIEYM